MNERDLRARSFERYETGNRDDDQQYAFEEGWNAALESEAVMKLVEALKGLMTGKDWREFDDGAEKYLIDAERALESFTKAKGGCA
jgi:hypothetical protein